MLKGGQKRPGSPLSGIRESPGSSHRAVFPLSDSPYTDNGRTINNSSTPSHRRGHSRGSSIGSLVNGFDHLSHHSRNSSLASISDAEPVWLSTPEGDMVERKPIARLRAPSSHPTSTPSSSSLRHPPLEGTSPGLPSLYRTSQILSTTTTEASPSAIPTNFSRLTNKANLKFEGDLSLMALGWSHDEWLVKRRLVQFFRQQDGNTIAASFRPVALQDIAPNSIVISCIFREDKNECFVTSVDTIYLLEALVAVRFTVEEKNRIRRNLEGFKPITVSKSKLDSEAFFKLIMGFPVCSWNFQAQMLLQLTYVFGPVRIRNHVISKRTSRFSRGRFLDPHCARLSANTLPLTLPPKRWSRSDAQFRNL